MFCKRISQSFGGRFGKVFFMCSEYTFKPSVNFFRRKLSIICHCKSSPLGIIKSKEVFTLVSFLDSIPTEPSCLLLSSSFSNSSITILQKSLGKLLGNSNTKLSSIS
ncbi:hypothetical protein APZ24_gp224 [Ostreococcus lucimarinus virus 2]|uniref:hypothetical protein n=1 Tax=Ostreococcus lucimarinus virus 2 TaxID=1663208 RepID=UPI0006D15D03|nr:hypothetical protein APZ24_gp224 [Ostreococcus lucimarinus virus 2]ALI95587.1 hypothetical protein OlV2_224c [Ostreococcus lucimarinus virus 2]